MREYFRYLRKCFAAAIHIWEQAERMGVLIAALLSAVAGVAYFAYGIEISLAWRLASAIAVFFGVWFLFLLIFVAPYSVYKAERNKIKTVAPLSPNMSMRSLFSHIAKATGKTRNGEIGWQVLDALSVGGLQAWGRKIIEDKRLSMHRGRTRPGALAEIPREYWGEAKFDYSFLNMDNIGSYCVYKENSNMNALDPSQRRVDGFSDVRVDRVQALMIWPIKN